MDYYYFVHGFPTAAPALFSNPATRTSNCQCTGEVDSHGFYDLWVQQFLDAGATSANLLQQECLHCSAERKRRQRVFGCFLRAGRDLPQATLRHCSSTLRFQCPSLLHFETQGLAVCTHKQPTFTLVHGARHTSPQRRPRPAA